MFVMVSSNHDSGLTKVCGGVSSRPLTHTGPSKCEFKAPHSYRSFQGPE